MISLSRQLGEDFTESVMIGANLTVPFRISSVVSRKKRPLVFVVVNATMNPEMVSSSDN
jgi:hypothetical protein